MPWADPPVAKTSLPLLIAIYDECDANMQNNLTVNTSLEAARRKAGRSYSNVCAEVDDLQERVTFRRSTFFVLTRSFIQWQLLHSVRFVLRYASVR